MYYSYTVEYDGNLCPASKEQLDNLVAAGLVEDSSVDGVFHAHPDADVDKVDSLLQVS